MTWLGAELSVDQRDIVQLVEAAALHMGDDESSSPHDADLSEWVTKQRSALGEQGIWSLGIDEAAGGGGAPLDLRLTALMALGGRSAALAWACAQAHAAVEVLGADERLGDLVESIVAAEAPVCVVDLESEHVRLVEQDERIHGLVERMDPAGASPHVVVLTGDDSAWLLRPDHLSSVRRQRCTGLRAAMTLAASVGDARAPEPVRMRGVDVVGVRSRLRLAGAAIAAGLAMAAAEQAVAYSHNRVQFGSPLTELPTVRAALFDQMAQAGGALAVLATPQDPVWAAAALQRNCESAINVCAAAVQSLGGYGYLAEYGVERLLRDAISLRAATDALGAGRASAARLVGLQRAETRAEQER